MDRKSFDYEDTLRRLTLSDERFVRCVLGGPSEPGLAGSLEPKTDRLVRLGALIALDAGSSALGAQADEALAAGASRDEVVGVLLSVGPSIGLARLVGVAPRLADALGYDVMEALERHDGH
jgi:alkylhydroperoxidase/carboxymuconolactone decarboxylase family protein YurZ